MPSSTGQITATEFTALAKQFAATSQSTAGRAPSWAWIDAFDAAPPSPFGPPPTGYLRASPLLVPARECPEPPLPMKAGDEDALSTGDDDDGDDAALPSAGERPGRLELHIVHSESYRVPVLLLQGQHPDGAPWTPDELRAHLRRRDASGVTPLSGNVVSQLEHPVLCVPSCCVDPCETASLMKSLLSGGTPAPEEADGGRLDYLSAWWSVLAPLVGAENRSAWYAKQARRREHASA